MGENRGTDQPRTDSTARQERGLHTIMGLEKGSTLAIVGAGGKTSRSAVRRMCRIRTRRVQTASRAELACWKRVRSLEVGGLRALWRTARTPSE